jgi:hypothetical protein
MAKTPAGHEDARDRRVGQIDRDRIVLDTAHAARGPRPGIRSGILVEPLMYLVEASTETSIRHGDPDPHRKPALGIASRL